MIRECRVTEASSAQGLRVLIMRRWPRGLKRTSVDMWVPDLGPSAELLKEYRDGVVDWPGFEERYKREQADQQQCRQVVYIRDQKASDEIVLRSPLQVLHDLEEQYKYVILMCWENHSHCHRFILINMYEAIYGKACC